MQSTSTNFFLVTNLIEFWSCIVRNFKIRSLGWIDANHKLSFSTSSILTDLSFDLYRQKFQDPKKSTPWFDEDYSMYFFDSSWSSDLPFAWKRTRSNLTVKSWKIRAVIREFSIFVFVTLEKTEAFKYQSLHYSCCVVTRSESQKRKYLLTSFSFFNNAPHILKKLLCTAKRSNNMKIRSFFYDAHLWPISQKKRSMSQTLIF